MTIELVSEGKKRKFHLPLSRLLLRLVLKAVLPLEKDESEGRVCGDGDTRTEPNAEPEQKQGKRSYTREEKERLIATAEELLKALRAFRRTYGKFTLVEIKDAADGDEVTIRV